MPNWCSNNISIVGPRDKIKQLWDRANSNESGLLESMVSIGEWDYSKARDTWGTKWDVSLEGLQYDESEDQQQAEISGWFESAWAPPLKAVATLCEENSDIFADIRYFEPGMAFVGRWNSKDQEDECYEIDPDELDQIPQDLREEFDIDSWYDQAEDEP